MALNAAPLDDGCPVCLGALDATCRTPCGHRFCRACIAASLRKSKSCPLCRAKISRGVVLCEASGEPLGRRDAESIFGQVYVQLGKVGMASMHFGRKESYVRFDEGVIPSVWVRDDKSPPPQRVPFTGQRYRAATRTFTGTLMWSQHTFGRCSRWDYEMVFSEDFDYIEGGFIRRIEPNGKLQAELRFGAEQFYRRLKDTIYGNVYITPRKTSLMRRALISMVAWKIRFDSRLLERLVADISRQPIVSKEVASLHFGEDDGDGHYISFTNASPRPRTDCGAPFPDRKYFLAPRFDPASRTFTGVIDWTATPVKGAARHEYRIVFDAELQSVVDGHVAHVSSSGKVLERKRFGLRGTRKLKYTLLLPWQM